MRTGRGGEGDESIKMVEGLEWTRKAELEEEIETLRYQSGGGGDEARHAWTGDSGGKVDEEEQS